MATLAPYLFFNGNCREAMTFYKEALGGKLDLQSVGESQMAAAMPQGAHKNIMHSVLEKDGFVLMASDMMEAVDVIRGNALTLCLVCKSKDEIESAFANLAAGGKVSHPLKEEFFGTFGDLDDKYGVSWMLQMEPAPKA